MDQKENKEQKKENNKSIIKIKDNNKEGNTQKNQNSIKSNKLQEKLKKIFLEREKAKYKYNKQLIPEQLKYHSDDEESNLGDKKDNNEKNIQIKTNDNIFNNKNSKINLNNDNNNDKNEDKKNEEDKIKIMENKEMVCDGNKECTQKNEMLKLKENNNESNKIKNKKRFRNNNNNENSDEYEYKQKYYELLNSKTVENKEKNSEKNDDKELLSRSLGDIRINNKEPIKDHHKIISNREKEKEPLHSIDSCEKKNVLKILELIKSKKSEREIIVQKKEEIKRSRSLAIFRSKEKEKEEKDNTDNAGDTNINTFNNKNKNKEIKRILTGKQIYKKNPKSHKINPGHKNKKNNYLTEVNSKNNENKNKNKNLISLPLPSPLNINEQNMNLFSEKNKIKSNRFVINNRLQNKQNKKENLNNDKSQFYQTSNRIKVTKKYEKPKISTNNNNVFNSTIYYNKSLSKNKKILENLESENENIPKSGKYHESIIYSPKKNKIKKIKSENQFTKMKKLDNDYNNNKDDNNTNNYSNYYVKKKTLLNESKNLSKSNYNIYSDFPNIPNFPNIRNYYNNSKIFLKNKYISINPSFSINNNFNNNKIEQIEINNNNEYLYKHNKSKEYEKNKINSKQIGSGSLNYSNNGNAGRYIYYKNKINVKNRNNIIDRSLQEKEINANESINTNTETNRGKIDDINYDYDYEYVPLGTEEMTYSNNNNKLKNAFLNLKVYPENNTFYQNESSPYGQRKLKIRASNTLNNIINYKRNYRLNFNEKKNSILMNIDNILIFEEKFSNIVSILKNKFSAIKQCLDFWNYYYNSLVYEKLEKIFNEEGDITIINMSIKYLLLSVMICYSFSNKGEIYNSNSNFLLLELMQLLELNYNSIMLIFLKINNLFLPENHNNSFLSIISSIYINYIKTSNYIDNSNLLLIEKIYNNIEKIDSKIESILSMKKFDFYKILYNFYFNIRQKDFKEINSFFIQCILTEESTDGSLFSSTHFILNNTSTLIPINPPYLRSPNKKKLTLILDLNDTLINFKRDQNGEGYVRIRPFLFGFLEEISQLYELIIFTNSEKEYADSVIEAIEHERTYFDHVFYRQHAIIVGDEFVKDLTRIGRPLNATIIIDNMPQNFKLQKENGILIKPFWGEDSSDRTLYDLMPILLDVAKDGGDVRHGLKKYRNEIIGKISSNILKK